MQLEDKLKVLRLPGMRFELECEPAFTKSELKAIERMVDAQLLHRHNAKYRSLKKKAKLKYVNATVNSINYQFCAGLRRHAVEQLASSVWVRRHSNVFIYGEPKRGKSFVACALGDEVLSQEFSLLSFDFADLIIELRLANSEGNMAAYLQTLNKARVLLVEDVSPEKMIDKEISLFNELVDSRAKSGSFIFTAEKPPAQWSEAFSNQVTGENIMKCLMFKAHVMRV